MVRIDPDGPTLVGGWSAASGLRHFPAADVCPFTGADDVVPIDLPRAGRLWLWTTVMSAPPGYEGPVPYDLGVVELDGEPLLRVVTRLRPGDHVEGAPMRLVVDELPGPDGEPLTIWAFE